MHFIKIIIMKHATVKTNDYSIGVKYTLQLHFLSIEILGKYVHVHGPPVCQSVCLSVCAGAAYGEILTSGNVNVVSQ